MSEYRGKILEKKDSPEHEYRGKVQRLSLSGEPVDFSKESNEYRGKVLDRKKRPLENGLDGGNETDKPKKDGEDGEKKGKDLICKVGEVCDSFFKKEEHSFRASVIPPKNNDGS